MRIEEYIPNRIKELCDKHQVSKYRLSQMTGISQTALGNILSGKNIPTVSTLERICDAFGLSIAQFFVKESMWPDLTKEQEWLLETWDTLTDDEKRLLKNFIQSLKKH